MKVLNWPNIALVTKAEPITEFDDSVASLAEEMHKTMTLERGIGLAANQVGALKRIIVINIPYTKLDHNQSPQNQEPWHGVPYTFINPEIIKAKDKVSMMEGCLSFPSLYEFIPRSAVIEVRYQTIKGDIVQQSFGGLMAVCLQHEIDHLDGIVFLDRMSQLKKKIALKKLGN